MHLSTRLSKIVLPKPTRRLFSTTILEVERKFAPTPTSLHLLRHNTGTPPFPSVKPLGVTRIHDIYYDFNDTKAGGGWLMQHGLYVRMRDGTWEAKVRRGGDTVNSMFEEFVGEEAMRAIVGPAFKEWQGEMVRLENGDVLDMLRKVADFETRREAWKVGAFEVLVDEADFGHCVGEVELCEKVEREGWRDAKGEVEREMDARIEKFMKVFAWAFPRGKVVGKLSAYFGRKVREEGGM